MVPTNLEYRPLGAAFDESKSIVVLLLLRFLTGLYHFMLFFTVVFVCEEVLRELILLNLRGNTAILTEHFK
jgi:hypothetical protein